MNAEQNEIGVNHSRSKLDRSASLLRNKAASEIIHEGIELDCADLLPTHYETFMDALPLDDPEQDVRFNSLVTQTALERYVLPMSDPISVLYLGSKLVEQTYYQIYRLNAPNSPLKNLSVSKQNGVFFTPRILATKMVSLLQGKAESRSLLDPCAGAGALLGEAIIQWKSLPYRSFVGVEADNFIALCANKILKRVAVVCGFDGEVVVEKRDGLEALMNLRNCAAKETTDIIINPPFGRMRFTKDRTTNKETYLEDRNGDRNDAKRLAQHAKETSDRIFEKFPELKIDGGIPELSKLFLLACALNAENGSKVSFIGPDTWMSGRQTASLRRKILKSRLVDEVVHIKESFQAFSTVNQHTSILRMSGEKSEHMKINDLGSDGYTHIPYEDIEKKGLDFIGIPRLSDGALGVYQYLDKLPKFGSIEWLKNARGEVDQSLQKNLFCANSTDIPLVRGTHIERFKFAHTSSEDKPSYLKSNMFEDFILNKPKAADFHKERIVGRQCSYVQQRDRLVFSRVPSGHAIGNSCNYLVIDKSDNADFSRLYLVLGLLGSSVLDWFFRVSNCNNHVANYEIDNFPFPENDEFLKQIAKLAEKLEKVDGLRNPKLYDRLKQLLDAYCCLAYEIEVEQDLLFVLGKREADYAKEVQNTARHLLGGVKVNLSESGETHFNHEMPKLSKLDKMVIEAVPEGGNWQDIPLSVPGERLVQIRKMTEERGVVRTTYYGRLRRDHPSYTINTYFNRPGNGTHIHPIEDRTLTSREAARLQSFPDNYVFTGSLAAIRNQIGNAVPPLLARAVGAQLAKFASGNLCVDMFCGAGGISLGLEAAGWHTLCGVDYDINALNTFALNRPSHFEPDELSISSTAVLRRDLLNEDHRNELYDKISRALGDRKLDLLIGGPPCQGFSHAGYRDPEDRRNDLASIFIEFAERLRPKIFVLENVEGLGTMKKGRVLSDIVRTLEDIGYKVSAPVWKLFSEEYGVPQMRRRLFIVASSNGDVSLPPPLPTHVRCRGRRESLGGALNLLDGNLLPYNSVQCALDGLSLQSDSPFSGELGSWLR